VLRQPATPPPSTGAERVNMPKEANQENLATEIGSTRSAETTHD
jgi:hypothetical protein